MTATFGSLFSGIGGMDLGLERAGMECKWQVEIDPFCSKVLAKHWPHVKRYGDIKTVDGSELERVDLIAGGFPCQDVSDAGKCVGINGARSGLWTEYLRLIRAIRPKFVLVENVTGLLKRGMGRVLGDLAESGYDAEWNCFSAHAIGGPQIRKRIFILAYARGYCNPPTLRKAHDFKESIHLESWHQWNDGIPGASSEGRENYPYSRIVREFHGIPARVDRFKSLGNAVIPQVAELIGRSLSGHL